MKFESHFGRIWGLRLPVEPLSGSFPSLGSRVRISFAASQPLRSSPNVAGKPGKLARPRLGVFRASHTLAGSLQRVLVAKWSQARAFVAICGNCGMERWFCGCSWDRRSAA